MCSHHPHKSLLKLNTAQVLLDLALELNKHAPSAQQYPLLLKGLKQVVPCDACALFRIDSQEDNDVILKPVAISGLSKEVLGQKFIASKHPRLQEILTNDKPYAFPHDSKLPDPFDGLLQEDMNHQIDVHACMGCCLKVEDTVIGILTIDAIDKNAFDKVSPITLESFAALAASCMRNVQLINTLKKMNHQQRSINQALLETAQDKVGDLLGISTQMQTIHEQVQVVAPSDFAVLITGETGTGKEVAAHAIYRQSLRSQKPMVYVNCAALPESIAESELFGHVKGAFTGANSSRLGKFEMADSGTIFLDEIGELPLSLQAKLLRVIQQGEVQRVGSDKHIQVNVRIIAATNRQLKQEVESGQFRADLYHRLNVFPVHLPALRHRKEDIPILAGHILEKIKHQFSMKTLNIHGETMLALQSLPWLGNVRELEHSIMRASLYAIQAQRCTILNQDFSQELTQVQQSPGLKEQMSLEPMTQTKPQEIDKAKQIIDSDKSSALLDIAHHHGMRAAVEKLQKMIIETTLKQNQGIWAKAAKQLQMDRGNLYKLGQKLNVKNTAKSQSN